MDDLKSVCRVCLQCNPETNSFSDEVEYDVYLKLANVFQKVTNIEVLESDEDKPTRLCQTCTERLLSAYDFICAVEEAELEIENYLRLESQSEEQLQQLEEDGEHGEEDEMDVVEIEATDIDIEDIEVLDEEFETDLQEQTKSSQGEEFIDEEQAELEQHEEIVIEEVINSEDILVISEDIICQETNLQKSKNKSRLSKALAPRPIKCDSCERTFAKIETLHRHIRTAHTFVLLNDSNTISQANDAIVSSDDNHIKCTHCPQTFKRRNNYVRHLLTTHSYDADQLSGRDKELAQTKHTYKRSDCPYCGENFSQASLVVHIRRHTGEKPYQCDQCDKAFPRRQDLVVHQRQHTGEKPHACNVCGKVFSRLNKLTRHMRIHTGERPYKCTQCERCFAQSNDLKIHMRRHTGEKPYKCTVCLEAFICGAALKTHRRQKNHHSPEDEFDDPFASWRVCKRKLITKEIKEETSEKEEL